MVNDRKSGIFAIKNIPNGKMYIGKTGDLRVTESRYLSDLRKGVFRNKALQEDFRIFDEKEFEFQVIEYCGLEELDEKKKFYIDFYGSNDKEIGYNVVTNQNYVIAYIE